MATTTIGIRAARELDELYRAHAPEVYRYVYAVLGNSADAEDVTQTTFVNALGALERGERPRKPTNWLITIAHNLIRQRFRQQQARPREVELDRELASVEADDDGPAIDDLVRALQRIPPSQREALVLRELEGRPYKEIASILEISPTALETLLFRARRSLAEELENLVSCDHAQLALSQQTDGRLGRKERKRLVAHLDECQGCARVAALGLKRRRAFKGLALMPLPLSLTLFKGAPSASAASGLPTLGAGAAIEGGGAVGGGTAVGGGAVVGGGAAGGVFAGGVAAKVAVAVVAVTVAGGASYEGVQRIRQPAEPVKAKTGPVPAVDRSRQVPTGGGSPRTVAPGNAGAEDPDGSGSSTGASDPGDVASDPSAVARDPSTVAPDPSTVAPAPTAAPDPTAVPDATVPPNPTVPSNPTTPDPASPPTPAPSLPNPTTSVPIRPAPPAPTTSLPTPPSPTSPTPSLPTPPSTTTPTPTLTVPPLPPPPPTTSLPTTTVTLPTG